MSSEIVNFFKVGKKYRILKNVKGLHPDLFYDGEIIIFLSEKYSRYDSMTIYNFRDNQGESKQFAISDGTSKDKLKEYFLELGA
jgi:hypothetical protein